MLELDDRGSVHCSSLTLDPHISFTLSDGSVILAWYSVDHDSEIPQEKLFENLEFGGALPKLPVEIYGLKPKDWAGDVTYTGHHLAYSQKGERFIEWGLYVPNDSPPLHSQMLGYDALIRFNLQPQPKCNLGYTMGHGILVKTAYDFEEWVIGAMAELSDDGRAPDGITYESVLQLAREIRESLAE